MFINEVPGAQWAEVVMLNSSVNYGYRDQVLMFARFCVNYGYRDQVLMLARHCCTTEPSL